MAVLELDFAAAEIGPPLEPDIDDLGTRNDVTARRRDGGSARAVDQDGPLGVDAIGRYKTRVDVNPESDADLPDHARWHLALGTIEDARFPQVTVDLDAAPALATAVSAVDVGDLIRISNLPDDLVPGLAELVILGYIETVPSHRRLITFNTLPATVYQQVGAYGPTSPTVSRYDSAHSTLAAAVDADDTSLLVVTEPDHALWVTGSSAPTFPMDVGCSGIRLPVSEIRSAVRDTYTRTVAAGSWGTSDTLHTYSLSGTASDFSVNGSQGLIDLSVLNSERHATIDVGMSGIHDARIWNTLPVTPTGAPINWGLLLRYSDASNYYWADVQVGTDSSLTLRLIKRVAGVATQITTAVAPATHSTSVPRILRAQYDPATGLFRSRVWSSDTTEPGHWQLSTTDTAVPAGTRIGAIARLMTGNTNTTPVQFQFDNFAVLNPQTFTVSRSADGIDKALAAGSQVRLWRPARFGL